MNRDDLLAFVNEKLLAGTGKTATTDSLLFKERLLDSVTVLSLIGYVEQKIGRRLTEREIALQNFASVSAMVTAFHA